MSFLETIIIAVVEGLTEFLPVSSTGHMIIAQSLLNMESDDFLKFFTVNIQLGAILSVVVLYRKRFFRMEDIKVFAKNPADNINGKLTIALLFKRLIFKYDFYWKLFIACIPGLTLGLLFDDMIDKMLGSVLIVAIMLVVGGLFMLFVDRWFNKTTGDQSITIKRAWLIGLSQCAAMFFPGLSRSMATIVGGMATKLNRKSAAEFSFFLAVPTMFGASLIKLLQLISEPGGAELIKNNLFTLFVGNALAFVVAMIAIKFFINYLTKYGFKVFGYYRILVGGVLLLLILSGVDLSMM